MALNRKILLNIARLSDKSISELAAKNDIPQSNLSKWFNGKKGGYVKEEKIDRMAKSLEVDYKTGKFLPGIHRWKVLTYEGIPLVFTLSSLSPGGGDLVLVRITINPYEVDDISSKDIVCRHVPDIVINGEARGAHLAYIVAIPYDRSFRLIIDIASPMAFSRIKEELKQTNSSWKFKKNKEGEITCLTFEADEKEIINRFGNKSLSVEELDRILVVEESQWTWDRLVASLKAQGKVPEEVARKEGLLELQ